MGTIEYWRKIKKCTDFLVTTIIISVRFKMGDTEDTSSVLRALHIATVQLQSFTYFSSKVNKEMCYRIIKHLYCATD